jgi:hypothetical protein
MTGKGNRTKIKLVELFYKALYDVTGIKEYMCDVIGIH